MWEIFHFFYVGVLQKEQVKIAKEENFFNIKIKLKIHLFFFNFLINLTTSPTPTWLQFEKIILLIIVLSTTGFQCTNVFNFLFGVMTENTLFGGNPKCRILLVF